MTPSPAASRSSSLLSARVGLIGRGAIAREVVGLLKGVDSRIACAALIREESARPTQFAGAVEPVTTIESLLQTGPHVVVEAAGHDAVATLVPKALSAGIPVVIASVGALADEQILRRLVDACAPPGGRLCIPSGAVGGLDYLRSLQFVPDATVSYTSRKAPAAWRSELHAAGVDVATVDHERVLFEGTAREAALRFPRNLNVAMAIALAGVGVHRTIVRVVADPHVNQNTHEILACSALGVAEFRFRNTPSLANPATSLLTAHSVVASICEVLHAGPPALASTSHPRRAV